MTITVEIPPQAEAKLRQQARARGLTLDAFLTTIIADQAAAMDDLKSIDSVGPEVNSRTEPLMISSIPFRFRRESAKVRCGARTGRRIRGPRRR